MRLIIEKLALPFAGAKLKRGGSAGIIWLSLTAALWPCKTRPPTLLISVAPNQHGNAAWPMARFVVLAEAGTHLIFQAELGRYKDSEIVLAEKVVAGLQKGILCMADRLLPCLGFWEKARATGAHLLWRAKTGLKLEPERVPADGS